MDQLRGLVGRLQAEEEHLLVMRRQRTGEYERLTYPLTLLFSLFLAGTASWRLQRSQASIRKDGRATPNLRSCWKAFRTWPGRVGSMALPTLQQALGRLHGCSCRTAFRRKE